MEGRNATRNTGSERKMAGVEEERDMTIVSDMLSLRYLQNT
jgi:hypothetical protein